MGACFEMLTAAGKVWDLVLTDGHVLQKCGPCFGIHVRSVRLRNTHSFGNSRCHENIC